MTPVLYDLTNVIFFPEPTVEEIAEQVVKVEELLEETQIDYRLNDTADSHVRVMVLTDRINALYAQMVLITSAKLKDDIINTC